MPLYVDLPTMLRDITGFLRSTGRDIHNADDPGRGVMGICTTDDPPVIWEICIQDVAHTGALPQEVRTALGTRAGRDALLDRLRDTARDGLADPDRPTQLLMGSIMRARSNASAPQAAEPPMPPGTADQTRVELTGAERPRPSIFDILLRDDA